MNLFELKDGVLFVSPEVLGIKIFKQLYTRDKTKAKRKALEEFSFIYFFADFKSDFSDIIDEMDRTDAIIEATVEDQKWRPDALLKEAIELYLERSNTVTTALLNDSKSAIKKISKFLKDIDLNEKDDRGKLVYNASQIAKTIGDMNAIVESVATLERKVKMEAEEDNNMRGGQKKNLFEDGI